MNECSLCESHISFVFLQWQSYDYNNIEKIYDNFIIFLKLLLHELASYWKNAMKESHKENKGIADWERKTKYLIFQWFGSIWNMFVWGIRILSLVNCVLWGYPQTLICVFQNFKILADFVFSCLHHSQFKNSVKAFFHCKHNFCLACKIIGWYFNQTGECIFICF